MSELFIKRLLLAFVGFALVASLSGQDKSRELEQRLKANPGDEETLLELGRHYHDLGASGDRSAVEKGIRIFDQLLAIDSTNVVAVAYRGALWTMQGRDSWWLPSKMKYVKRGCDELDRAVEMDPGNIMVRLIRGINGLGLPEYAERLTVALEDFIVLLRRPDFQEQPKELKAIIFYYGGLAHKRADDYDTARELFKRAIGILPGSEYAKRSQEELSDM